MLKKKKNRIHVTSYTESEKEKEKKNKKKTDTLKKQLPHKEENKKGKTGMEAGRQSTTDMTLEPDQEMVISTSGTALSDVCQKVMIECCQKACSFPLLIKLIICKPKLNNYT